MKVLSVTGGLPLLVGRSASPWSNGLIALAAFKLRGRATLIAAAALAAVVVDSSAIITTYSDRPTFLAAVGGTFTTEDFTDDDHIPIASGILNQFTAEAGLVPGDIEPGVTYSTPVGRRFFFNIDAGGGYTGGFLDGFYEGDPDRALTITFGSAASAFGFDSNVLMGNDFDILIKFASGPDYAGNFSVAGTVDLQFFGFQSSQTDILSVIIHGNGEPEIAFALDNFTFNAGGSGRVPDSSSTFALLGLSIAGFGLFRTQALRMGRR
jgi:hypothetical protein